MVAVLAGGTGASGSPGARPLDETDGLGVDALQAVAEEPAAARAPAADLRELRRRIAEIVARRPGLGVAVAVIGPEGSLIEGFGRAAPERNMDANVLFRVGSVTKSLVSIAMMRLVEQGKIRLDDRVLALAPEIARNPFEKTHPLRVEHLLEHTAGFDEMRFNEIIDPARNEDRTLREVLAVNPRSREARWPPGTRHAYSQPGYTTAAYLIEKASGMPYERYLEEQVFRPLGMRTASMRLGPETRARLAQGHHGGRPEPYLHMIHRPAMNLMISAQDLSRLLRMLLGRGVIDGQRFLGAASVARIESSALPYGPPNVRYGLGNWGDVSGPVPMRGHGGFMPGYQSFYRYEPRLGIAYATLTNDTGRGLGGVGGEIFAYLMAGRRPSPPPTVPQRPEVLAGYAGRYQLASPNIEFTRFHTDVYRGIEVTARGDQLWLTLPEKSPVPLVASGPGFFRFFRQSDSSIVFTRDAAGKRVVVIGQQYYEEESAWWAAARKWLMEGALTLLMSTLFIPIIIAARGVRSESALLLRPLLAALCLFGMSVAFGQAREHGLLGARSLVTVAFWLLSWAFGLMSYSALAHAARATRSEAHAAVRAYALLASLAAVWITMHLSRYGVIGLRTWRW
jgi:CubicO group peptidase (beta-lactamase class C family)